MSAWEPCGWRQCSGKAVRASVVRTDAGSYTWRLDVTDTLSNGARFGDALCLDRGDALTFEDACAGVEAAMAEQLGIGVRL